MNASLLRGAGNAREADGFLFPAVRPCWGAAKLQAADDEAWYEPERN
jgi:hypothetical protein